MKHWLVRQDQLFTLFLVSKKRASNENEIVIDVQTVYETNHIRTAEMKSNEEWSTRCEQNSCNCVSCLKKIQDLNGVWTRDLAIPVRCSNQLSYEATDVGSWSIMSSYVPVKEMNVIAVYEINHIRTPEMKSNEEWSSQLWTQFIQLHTKIQDFNEIISLLANVQRLEYSKDCAFKYLSFIPYLLLLYWPQLQMRKTSSRCANFLKTAVNTFPKQMNRKCWEKKDKKISILYSTK